MRNIVIIMGKSGAGKDSIAKAILENSSYERLRECTTRPMRDGESEGNPYHFITVDEVDKEMVAKTVFHTKHGDWYYGFVNGDLDPDTDYLTVANPSQVHDLCRMYKDRFHIILIEIVTDEEDRIVHMIEREEGNKKDYEEVCRRIKADQWDFSKENVDFTDACERADSHIRVMNDYIMTPDEIAEEILMTI